MTFRPLALAVLLLWASTVHADPLMLSFLDPVGDQPAGDIDVVALDLTFDNLTGDYQIVLTADAANPFIGVFRININLFNPDTGTTAQDPSLFQDTQNDFDLIAPTTIMLLTGTNVRLTSWGAGDRVAINSGAFGNPDGAFGFGSTVGAELIGAAGNDIGGSPFATVTPVQAVPAPSALTLVSVAGLLGCLWRRIKPRTA